MRQLSADYGFLPSSQVKVSTPISDFDLKDAASRNLAAELKGSSAR